ncbi:hypothetical protein HDIA_0735 [Hartmannibacter diazotrophicus]|uniref:Uncharacterized protein n=1 Tax=Hartmannibacter diazotrophicus TaxID=1482074 RepID=A0A2C9D201_9HYPH|nr:hypothetical protein [Hartmannibacter diazotrophicus]SON54276.1 hypothetical protein HDIA_0735 [Hartmannibacter diazotrophicus]
MFYHLGLAEALGVSETQLERMSLRELSDRAFKKGFELKLDRNGVGKGLTLHDGRPNQAAQAR